MLSSFSEREGVADPDGRVELPVVGEALELRVFLVGVDILLVIIIGPAGGRRRACLARRPRAPRLRPGLDIVGGDSRTGEDGDLLCKNTRPSTDRVLIVDNYFKCLL